MKTHDPADPRTVTTRPGMLSAEAIADELQRILIERDEILERSTRAREAAEEQLRLLIDAAQNEGEATAEIAGVADVHFVRALINLQRQVIARLTRERDEARGEATSPKIQHHLATLKATITDLTRERDDANERVRLAVVRADIVQRERDEALRKAANLCPECVVEEASEYRERFDDACALLRRLEWIEGVCLLCHRHQGPNNEQQPYGHADDCPFRAVLEPS